jgi:hypothetical protein
MKQGWQVAGRIKASGGCENLKAQADGLWKARHQSRCPRLAKRCRGPNLRRGDPCLPRRAPGCAASVVHSMGRLQAWCVPEGELEVHERVSGVARLVLAIGRLRV